MSGTKGITRIPNGYLARHYWGKPEPISEYFYDHEYGSRDDAEISANRWLERMEKEYPKPVKKKRQPGISHTRTNDGSGRTVYCIEVFWTSYPDEKKHNKKFLYYNDLEKRQAEHDAEVFCEARKRELSEL